MSLFPVALAARCRSMSRHPLVISFGAIGIPHLPFLPPPRFAAPPCCPPPPPVPPPPPRLALPPPALPRAPAVFWFPLKLVCPRSLDARVFPPGSYPPPSALLRPPVLPLSFAKPRAGSAARLAGWVAAGRFEATGLAGRLGRFFAT